MLKGADRVRLKPSVIFGSDGLEGCAHSFFEIVSNSIDEAKDGYGNKIIVKRFADHSIEVQDFGRGIPLDFNKSEGRYNWELVFCELYAGGKYDKNQDNYQFSLGLNGLGACATQYASSFFDVEVVRDGYKYNLHFEKGENIGGLSKKPTKEKKTGTIQRWKPDLDVFTDIDIPLEFFRSTLKRQAIINPGLTFVLYDEASDKEETYYYENGIFDYIKEIDSDKGITTPFLIEGDGVGRDREDRDDYKVKASLAFCFNNESKTIEYYHNSSWLELGGSPDKAVRTAFVSIFDKEIKSRNKYNKGESKISFSDIEDSLILICNSFSTETSYANQTKKAINNKYIQDFLTSLIKEKLEIWFIENKSDGDKAITQVLANKRSRESAEKQRLTVKKKLMGSIDINNRVKKFVDCRSRDKSKRELFIVEGDSALGSVKLGRDAEFQAIMPIRGKILNCLKADINTILKSDIITDLIRVLGCGIDVKIKNNRNLAEFDIDKLNYNKVIIATDADYDGFQIRTLVATMIYVLCPKLIEEGYLYIVETPLYEISYKDKNKEKTLFAFDEAEKNRLTKGLDVSKLNIQRSKGLGENEPEMMWETTMNPENRRLIRLSAEDPIIMKDKFDLFLGNDLERRKEYIKENGHLYLDDLDLS